MGLLAGIAVIYIAALGGIGWLLSRWRGKALFRTLWLSFVFSIVVVVVAIPLFNGIAGLYRYDPPGDILSGSGIQRQDWQAYASVAIIAFFALYGLLIAFGSVIGYVLARPINQGKTCGFTTALIVLFYLVLSMPIVDFFNACMIGKPFLLPVGC